MPQLFKALQHGCQATVFHEQSPAELPNRYAVTLPETMASQVIATNFQTVAAANNYWK
ncbi:MAG: hypothetical protein HKN05_22355 [Rhizobiales bacterium]|nr:hypothetical protein [Hyphomicrobiales bacterium]